ncbi:MAG: AraC family transcriptional regulator [Flavobacteriaceae bacterium]
MKLHLLDRTSTENRSFTIKQNTAKHFLKVWHYHPEFELVMIQKSQGTRFIGDSIHKFTEGEVVLIGKNLPHMWLNDDIYFEGDSKLEAQALAVHFDQNFLGQDFFGRPEMHQIAGLLHRARCGIRFNGLKDDFDHRMQNLLKLDGFEQLMGFLSLLNELAVCPSFDLLSSTGFSMEFHSTNDRGLDKMYAYVFKNFKNPIHSRDVAEVVHMNPSSFSRYFKRMHRKTFTRYLNEIRIGYACKLLIEDSSRITTVCFESGFNNVSNFNRQFRAIMGMTPSQYVKKCHRV